MYKKCRINGNKLIFLRLTALIFITILLLSFSGCSSSKQIDKASLANMITADKKNGKTFYSFYILEESEEVNCVEVQAKNFENAYSLAKEKYIPNLSLAKLEFFVMNENIYKTNLKKDISYISQQSFISPKIKVSLSDANTMKFIAKTKDASKKINEHIILLKNKNNYVCIDALGIFNNYNSLKDKYFLVSYIKSKNDIEAVTKNIYL